MNVSIEESITRIADLGFEGLELLADEPHAWPVDLSADKKRAIRECLQRNGLAISNINGFMMNAIGDPRNPYWHPSWIEPNRDYRAVRREHTKRVLRLAKQFDAPSMQTEPGGPLAPGQSRRVATDIFYDEIMPCVETAEELGVFLLIEPEPGLLIETFEQYLEFADRLDSPWVGLNFDIGHAFCVGQDPQQWIARMAPHTKHYHIEDIAASREHVHLIPGRGAIDFHAVMSEIVKTGYKGWITVELYSYVANSDEAGKEAKEFLEGVMREIEKDEG
ncbi:MAG: sugar phosphate isomerase/epimerase family protein [Thermoguttaceae bacterium]|jgi:sugar phosphate isomerase/epimerase